MGIGEVAKTRDFTCGVETPQMPLQVPHGSTIALDLEADVEESSDLCGSFEKRNQLETREVDGSKALEEACNVRVTTSRLEPGDAMVDAVVFPLHVFA